MGRFPSMVYSTILSNAHVCHITAAVIHSWHDHLHYIHCIIIYKLYIRCHRVTSFHLVFKYWHGCVLCFFQNVLVLQYVGKIIIAFLAPCQQTQDLNNPKEVFQNVLVLYHVIKNNYCAFLLILAPKNIESGQCYVALRADYIVQPWSNKHIKYMYIRKATRKLTIHKNNKITK